MNAHIQELLAELSHENPRPEEKWRREGDWDPRFRRGTISKAEDQGLVEVDRQDPAEWRLRFTEKGRFKIAGVVEAEGEPRR